MKKINIIAIIGKSGSGKDTILNRVLTHNPSFNRIINCTSRPPRDKEKNGENYYFLSKEAFKEKIDNNEMIEYSEFNNWYYGTSLATLDINKINIGIFNPASLKMLSNNDNINLLIFLVDVKDKERLIRSLNREKDPDIKEVIRRYEADDKDFLNIENNYDYTRIHNDTGWDMIMGSLRIMEYGERMKANLN